VNQYFATVARGWESLAAIEIENLGGKSLSNGFCGVNFCGDRQLLYKTNLHARLPFRILLKIDEFPCQDADDLYRGIKKIDWQLYLSPDYSLAVNATGKNKALNHTHFTALQVKNAIVDRQREELGDRSPIDPKNPDVLVNIHIDRDRCLVSLDSSGSSLHRRGYRRAVGSAPLKESLAAGLISLSDWQPDLPFFDPLCGSGTLPIEAGLQALNIAPGLFRTNFGFETWPDFDRNLWNNLVKQARSDRQDSLMAAISGSDRDRDVIKQARDNAFICGLEKQIQFQQKDLAQIEAPADRGVLFCNPPYGARLGSDRDLGEFYRLLGKVLKERFKGWTAFVLSGNKQLASSIGLKSSQRIPFYNGSIPCKLMKYELY